MADRIRKLTPVQRDVLRAIARLTDAQGWPPTVRELADAVGITVSTAHWHLVNLESGGWLRRRHGSPRAIAVIERGGLPT